MNQWATIHVGCCSIHLEGLPNSHGFLLLSWLFSSHMLLATLHVAHSLFHRHHLDLPIFVYRNALLFMLVSGCNSDVAHYLLVHHTFHTLSCWSASVQHHIHLFEISHLLVYFLLLSLVNMCSEFYTFGTVMCLSWRYTSMSVPEETKRILWCSSWLAHQLFGAPKDWMYHLALVIVMADLCAGTGIPPWTCLGLVPYFHRESEGGAFFFVSPGQWYRDHLVLPNPGRPLVQPLPILWKE